MEHYLNRANWLLEYYDNNTQGLLEFNRKLVEGNLPHINGLIENSAGDSDTDLKVRTVISTLLMKISENTDQTVRPRFYSEVQRLIADITSK